MITTEITREQMPTATTANNHPVHRWYNFIAGYSPEYVEFTIKNFKKRNGYLPRKIYDPFAGCATTNVVANDMGIPSIGVERNPIFYRIGKAKTNAARMLDLFPTIANEFHDVISEHPREISNTRLPKDAATYLNKLFEERTLKVLLQLRDKVLSYSDSKFDAGFIFLNKILDMATNSQTDGIYKAPTSKKKAVALEDAVRKTLFEFQKDSLFVAGQDNLCEYIFDSSTNYEITSETIDLVVFSPPYLNNFDFAEMTRMQLYFWGEAGSWKEISDKHRNHMIVNTTTALKLVRSPEEQAKLRLTLPNCLLKKLDVLVGELEVVKKTRPSRKPYDLLVYPYFSQMQEVLLHCYNGMKQNGAIHIIVSDAAFYGVHVDTQNFLAEIMLDIGFKSVSIGRLRTRGDRWELKKRAHSGKQLGEYEIIAHKE